MHFRTYLCIAVALVTACAPRVTRPILPEGAREYEIDISTQLRTDPDTSLQVVMDLPSRDERIDTLCFPPLVPGSYTVTRYGRFVRDLVALDHAGDTVPFTVVDSTYFLFDRSPSRIEYRLIATTAGRDSIPRFTGTHFGTEYRLLNTYAAFGYIPSLKDKPIRIRLAIPESWTVGTALDIDSAGALFAHDYPHLYDSPILAGELSHAAFTHNERSYFIYTYAENPRIQARRLRGHIRSGVEVADAFLDGIPTERYWFLITVHDSLSEVIGAHEHRKSSVYSLKGDLWTVRDILDVVVPHELFHTLIPLRLQSEEIREIDYIGVNRVRHLWFYEGLAQYSTYKMRLCGGQLSLDEFLDETRTILIQNELAEDSLSLDSLSRSALYDREAFVDMYRRGYTLGLTLDLRIATETSGEKTLKSVLQAMADRYPPGNPFPTDSLFGILADLSVSSVQPFLENHVLRNNEYPLKKLFDNVGVEYNPREPHPVFTANAGFMPFPDEESNRVVVGGIYPSVAGTLFEEGDTLLSINGEQVYADELSFAFRELLLSEPGKSFNAVVKRGADKVSFVAESHPFYRYHTMEIRVGVDMTKRLLREAWMNCR